MGLFQKFKEGLKKTQAKLVHEIKLVPKPDGGLSLIFNNSDQLLTIEVASDRVHMVIATFVQIAERAGWEFPPAASWLESTSHNEAGKALPN